ncbi:hypothetical protein SD78_1741 [Bacillus badius]|nr:hypothetical protein SD78_1741 [Bacillus badius]
MQQTFPYEFNLSLGGKSIGKSTKEKNVTPFIGALTLCM